MPIDVQVINKATIPNQKAPWLTTGLMEGSGLERNAAKSFDEVLELRRSPTTLEDASLDCALGFIRHVFRSRQMGEEKNVGLARKPSISAGALHPIDVVIVAGAEVEEPVLFNDYDNTFLTLPVRNASALAKAVVLCREIVPASRGHLLLLTGDRSRVSQKYRPADSLLWRDAGAALQSCAMAAFAYGFAFCPLGDTGRTILDQLSPPHEDFVALALGVFGLIATAE